MFMSSMYGNPELFIADADGSHPKRITHSVGANTSATWNPKTGQQVAFVSDRGGTPQLYTMDADGGEVQKIPLPDMGYVIDPAWSPNGQLLAFSWRRPNGNYDLYVMDIATHALVELTRDAGRNERPELGARRTAHGVRVHAHRHAANLVHAGRWNRPRGS